MKTSILTGAFPRSKVFPRTHVFPCYMTWAGSESNVSSLARVTVMKADARADESVLHTMWFVSTSRERFWQPLCSVHQCQIISEGDGAKSNVPHLCRVPRRSCSASWYRGGIVPAHAETFSEFWRDVPAYVDKLMVLLAKSLRAEEPKIACGYCTVTERTSKRVEEKPGREGRPEVHRGEARRLPRAFPLRARVGEVPREGRIPVRTPADPLSSFTVSGAGRTAEFPQAVEKVQI